MNLFTFSESVIAFGCKIIVLITNKNFLKIVYSVNNTFEVIF